MKLLFKSFRLNLQGLYLRMLLAMMPKPLDEIGIRQDIGTPADRPVFAVRGEEARQAQAVARNIKTAKEKGFVNGSLFWIPIGMGLMLLIQWLW